MDGVSSQAGVRCADAEVRCDYARRRPGRRIMMRHPTDPCMSDRTHASELPALVALCAGALSIGSSGIFVRLSETGPTATAFWRGAFALPFLLLWAWLERRSKPPPRTALRGPRVLWARALFAR